MNGGKKIALMRIAEAVEDWADQWYATIKKYYI